MLPPTLNARAKSLAASTYVQPRAAGSSWISSFATAASAASRDVPARASSVRYGDTPPTDRAQPVCSSTVRRTRIGHPPVQGLAVRPPGSQLFVKQGFHTPLSVASC